MADQQSTIPEHDLAETSLYNTNHEQHYLVLGHTGTPSWASPSAQSQDLGNDFQHEETLNHLGLPDSDQQDGQKLPSNCIEDIGDMLEADETTLNRLRLDDCGKQTGQNSSNTVVGDMSKNYEDKIVLNHLGLPGWGEGVDSESQTSQIFASDLEEKLVWNCDGFEGGEIIEFQVLSANENAMAYGGMQEEDTLFLKRLSPPLRSEPSVLILPDHPVKGQSYEETESSGTNGPSLEEDDQTAVDQEEPARPSSSLSSKGERKSLTPPNMSVLSLEETLTRQVPSDFQQPSPVKSSPHAEAPTDKIFDLAALDEEKNPGRSLKRCCALDSATSPPRRRRIDGRSPKAETDGVAVCLNTRVKRVPASTIKKTVESLDDVIKSAVKKSLSIKEVILPPSTLRAQSPPATVLFGAPPDPVTRAEERREDLEKLKVSKVPKEPGQDVLD